MKNGNKLCMSLDMDIENKNKKAAGSCVCKLQDYREYDTTNRNGPELTTNTDRNGPTWSRMNWNSKMKILSPILFWLKD